MDGCDCIFLPGASTPAPGAWLALPPPLIPGPTSPPSESMSRCCHLVPPPPSDACRRSVVRAGREGAGWEHTGFGRGALVPPARRILACHPQAGPRERPSSIHFPGMWYPPPPSEVPPCHPTDCSPRLRDVWRKPPCYRSSGPELDESRTLVCFPQAVFRAKVPLSGVQLGGAGMGCSCLWRLA